MTLPRPLPAAVLAALCAVFQTACSEVSEEPIEVREVVTTLLARTDLRRDLAQNEAFPIRQDLIKPRGSGSGEYGARSALELSPPARVSYTIPQAYAGLWFDFSLAIVNGSYAGEGSVTFTADLDGERVYERSIPSSAALGREERRWHDERFRLTRGGELVLSTAYRGDQAVAPRAAVGLLRVVVPYEVPRAPADPEAPNAVLIVIDTLRADRLHAYGNPAPVSPAMDELAARGVLFERAFANAPWTVPSTVSILTGMSPPEHGVGFADSFTVADSILTLAEAFQRAGFTTGAIACNPLIAPTRNFDQGFEHFSVHNWSSAPKVAGEVGAWLRANAHRRFFLYLHFVDPHFPYEPSPQVRERLVSSPPEGFISEELDRYLRGWYPGGGAAEEVVRASAAHQLELYDAEIFEVDSVVGEVGAVLAELGLAENTLVAVTSDHGEEFLEHGWAGHHNQLFDESTHVPLILAGPGVAEGERVAVGVENRRIAPTLLRLCGVEPTRNLRGPSLVEPDDLARLGTWPVFLTNTKGRWADLETRSLRELGQVHSVIHEGWRLIWSPGGGEEGELVALFDLQRDPGSLRDVAAEHPERVAALRRLGERVIVEGQARRPALVPSTDATLDLLRDIGYLGDD
ncbi:MAG: sulfatase [Planctomycetota bacterium]|jgi:arylsulfatase A-like enzyme|nr:sulfatase [Planctomycetota bacterium]